MLYFLADIGDFIGDIESKITISIPALITQLLATLILFLIVKKFLYKPGKEFINKRKEFITSQIEEASTLNTSANQNLEKSESTLKDAYKEAHKIVDEAKVEALNQKDKILADANKEVTQKRNQLVNDLENEKKKMQQEIHDEIVDVAMLAVNKIVEKQVDKKDTEKIISEFIEK